jgi:hypothetical protein
MAGKPLPILIDANILEYFEFMWSSCFDSALHSIGLWKIGVQNILSRPQDGYVFQTLGLRGCQ